MYLPTKLTVQITKTADGSADYVQILSGDQFSINVVLIAAKIEVRDQRSQHTKGADEGEGEKR